MRQYSGVVPAFNRKAQVPAKRLRIDQEPSRTTARRLLGTERLHQITESQSNRQSLRENVSENVLRLTPGLTARPFEV